MLIEFRMKTGVLDAFAGLDFPQKKRTKQMVRFYTQK